MYLLPTSKRNPQEAPFDGVNIVNVSDSESPLKILSTFILMIAIGNSRQLKFSLLVSSFTKIPKLSTFADKFLEIICPLKTASEYFKLPETDTSPLQLQENEFNVPINVPINRSNMF